jgi:hypothetical protein
MLSLSLTTLALAGCPGNAVYDCPSDGEYVSSGVGRYCAYGVVIGGFDCPSDLPNRYDFESSDPSVPDGFVCSDRPVRSRDDVPAEVCRRVPACASPLLDAGLEAGSGVCCEPSASPCSMPTIGGWAPSMAECPGPTASFDGRWRRGTDMHGCPYWIDVLREGGMTDVCCGCVPEGDAGSDAPAAGNACTRLGGMCTLPTGGLPPTVSCGPGFTAISGSETGLGGYRQLGCGSVEAGPLACCVPTFACGTMECPVIDFCVSTTPGEPGPDTFGCVEPTTSACDALADCMGSECAPYEACLAEICPTAPDLAMVRVTGRDVYCGALP